MYFGGRKPTFSPGIKRLMLIQTSRKSVPSWAMHGKVEFSFHVEMFSFYIVLCINLLFQNGPAPFYLFYFLSYYARGFKGVTVLLFFQYFRAFPSSHVRPFQGKKPEPASPGPLQAFKQSQTLGRKTKKTTWHKQYPTLNGYIFVGCLVLKPFQNLNL